MQERQLNDLTVVEMGQLDLWAVEAVINQDLGICESRISGWKMLN
jgi:hypothetical protein